MRQLMMVVLCLLAGGCARTAERLAFAPEPAPIEQIGNDQLGVDNTESDVAESYDDDPPSKFEVRKKILRPKVVSTKTRPSALVVAEKAAEAKLPSRTVNADEVAEPATVGSVKSVVPDLEVDAPKREEEWRRLDEESAAAVRTVCGGSATC